MYGTVSAIRFLYFVFFYCIHVGTLQSSQKHAPGGSGVDTGVQPGARPSGRGAGGVRAAASAVRAWRASRSRASVFFVAQKSGFYFSLHASLYAIYGHVCVHGSLNFGGPVPPPGRFGIWAPSWLNDGTFASLACAYCLALEVCALTCSFTRSHFDWNQR